MSRLKKAVAAMGTFSVALGIGFIMQYDDAAASRFDNDNDGHGHSHPSEAAQSVQTGSVFPQMMTPDDTDPVISPNTISLASLSEAPIDTQLDIGQLSVPTPGSCAVRASAAPTSDAMVVLTVSSACNVGSSFVIHHQGMMFSEMVGENGITTVTVPALSENASFFVSFPDGRDAAVTIPVPEVSDFERVVLQWEGPSSLAIASDDQDALGYSSILGNDIAGNGLFAHVYSYPTGKINASEPVGIHVRAGVTDAHCGGVLTAQSLQFLPEDGLTTKDIRVTLPTCDELGTFLELKKIYQDLTLRAG